MILVSECNDLDSKCDNSYDHIPQKGGYGKTVSEDNEHTPHFVPYAKSTICESHPVLNGGCNNNTRLNNTRLNNIKSISQSEQDRLIDEVRESLKEQIEYLYFEENCPDQILGIDAIVSCMTEMFVMPTTKINGIMQSREALIPYIKRVDSCTIREFLDHMRGKAMRNVKSINAYWRTAFINYLREQEFIKLVI